MKFIKQPKVVMVSSLIFFLLAGCAGVGNNIRGVAKLNEGNYAESEVLLKRSLADAERQFGPQNAVVAGVATNLGDLYIRQLRLDLAEQYFQRAFAIRQNTLPANHPDLAAAMSNLGAVYKEQGRYEQAEPQLRKALEIIERALGAEHPNVAAAIANLGMVYKSRGQHDLAEPLYRRALAINEKAYGKEHRVVANSLNNLGVLLRDEGRYQEAEALHKRALSIREKKLGSNDPTVGQSLNNLAYNYYLEQRYSEAEPVCRRALAVFERALGPDNLYVAGVQSTLANILYKQGKFSLAEPLYKRAMAVGERWLGADHPQLAEMISMYAAALAAEGRFAESLALARRATASLAKRIVQGRSGEIIPDEVSKYRNSFINHLAVLSRNPLREPRMNVIDESFRVSQLEQASGTAAAVAKMAARFAQGNDAIAQLVKSKQDALGRQAKGENNLLRALSESPESRNAASEQQIRNDIVRAGAEIDSLDAQLNSRFPEYQLLTRPEPLPLAKLQGLLGPKEAVLTYTVADEQSWLWLVRADRAELIPLSVGRKTLEAQIQAVRDSLTDGIVATSVDLDNLHALYQEIFKSAVPHLANIDHVMLVPAGPLQSLPFSMLVALPPKSVKDDADYRSVDWLMKRYALTTLPSASSLWALRHFAKQNSGSEPFIGFGDPLLREESGQQTRSSGAIPDGTRLFRSAAGINSASNLTVADPEVLRNAFSRLLHSAGEITQMAQITKASQNAIWLQERATESNVKRLDLSKFKVIAFATHGTMANEISTGAEPGLILTPPARGTVTDDGYLTASEIARLKLNADFVMLSACNTAASDGTPGAEGMSGLAKAFFYAGSRSLLVSHWPVDSASAVKLTTALLREHEAAPLKGKAEAHRKAILSLMNRADSPQYAHPYYWAPFVVVGEGSAMAKSR